MTTNIISFPKPTFDPIRVELTSPGTVADGRRIYFVDYVEADGCRSCMCSGHSYAEGIEAARECAAGEMPVLDLVMIT